MQKFTNLTPDMKLKDSRIPLLDNDLTIASHYAAGSFPTQNLVVGMECYRTDLGSKYRLASANPVRWEPVLQLEEITEYMENAIFPGMILSFSGEFINKNPINKTTGKAQVGWTLCDGTRGTPNLIDCFVMGTDVKNVGKKGGSNYKTLTINEMPAHSHACTINSSGDHTHSVQVKNAGEHRHMLEKYKQNHGKDGRGTTEAMWSNGDVYADSVPIQSTDLAGNHGHVVSINDNGAHTHIFAMENKGGTEKFDNRPQFYTLAYIMKL